MILGSFTSHYTPPTQKYCRDGKPGLHSRSIRRRLKVTISIWRNDQAGLPTKLGQWTTRCESHGAEIVSKSIYQAHVSAGDSAGWCSGCAKLARKRGIE